MQSRDYLRYYSRVFDYVEIDSSFYHAPTTLMTGRWSKATPEGFRFTAKVPRSITHDRRLGNGSDDDLYYFHKAMQPMRGKLLCLLFQLPPSMTKKEGLKKLQSMPFENGVRYALEARHKSWFDDEVYSFLKRNDICLAWSQLDEIQTPPVVTTDFVYLRFIGDRSIAEENFGSIQKDRTSEMRRWADVFRGLTKKISVSSAIVAANNHYAGFGPVTANTFRKMLGLMGVEWEESKQSSLSDFS